MSSTGGRGTLHSMSHYHLVRVGAMGQVGRFAAVDAVRYPRHSRVVVRTRRGLEVGEVLTPTRRWRRRPCVRRRRDPARHDRAGRPAAGAAGETSAGGLSGVRDAAERAAACRRCWSTSSTCSTARDCSSISSATCRPSWNVHRPAGRDVRGEGAVPQVHRNADRRLRPRLRHRRSEGPGGCETCTSCAVARHVGRSVSNIARPSRPRLIERVYRTLDPRGSSTTSRATPGTRSFRRRRGRRLACGPLRCRRGESRGLRRCGQAARAAGRP